MDEGANQTHMLKLLGAATVETPGRTKKWKFHPFRRWPIWAEVPCGQAQVLHQLLPSPAELQTRDGTFDKLNSTRVRSLWPQATFHMNQWNLLGFLKGILNLRALGGQS